MRGGNNAPAVPSMVSVTRMALVAVDVMAEVAIMSIPLEVSAMVVAVEAIVGVALTTI